MLIKNFIRSAKYYKNLQVCLLQSKRHAGHSKWQNIKHIKEAKDLERSALFKNFSAQMKIAIAEHGSPKPEDNRTLARIIEQAKKANMPLSSIKKVLEKASSSNSKESSITRILTILGPYNTVLIIETHSEQFQWQKQTLQNIIKKFNAKLSDSSILALFDYTGVVMTEPKDLNTAMEDAINVSARDVDEVEINNKKYLKFICDGEELEKAQSKLEKLNYSIISAHCHYAANNPVDLSDEEAEHVDLLCKRIRQIENIDRIHDNIA
ncbi:translational activator of cytochrome c oxidase 1 [Prorops nasuta]|uniref:translational activator of cytochrome c oxidase 1 n=1 Tax=Prorops nasuta TaxID=863751 RepID=UPI0034CF1961